MRGRHPYRLDTGGAVGERDRGDELARGEGRVGSGADRDDLAGELVARHDRDLVGVGHQLCEARQRLAEVEVAAAYAGRVRRDQELPCARLRVRKPLDPYAAAS